MTMGKGIPQHDGNFQLAPCVHSCLPLNLRCGKDKKLHSLGSFGNQVPPFRCILAEFGKWKRGGGYLPPAVPGILQHHRKVSCSSRLGNPAPSFGILQHHRKLSCSNRLGNPAPSFLEATKSGHRSSSLTSVRLVGECPEGKTVSTVVTSRQQHFDFWVTFPVLNSTLLNIPRVDSIFCCNVESWAFVVFK